MSKASKNTSHRKLYTVGGDAPFQFVEAYKSLRTNLEFLSSAGNCKTILITSSVPEEGKSNVALNLAMTLTASGNRVVLVDCDLRKATISRYLRIPRNHAGLTNVITSKDEGALAAALVRVKDSGITVLTAGTIPPNPTELLSTPMTEKIFASLQKAFDYVIIDTPPVSVVTDAAVLCGIADGVLLVVRPGEKVPIDGEVISGESTLNTAALTGESKPRFVHPGSEIISGCVNGDGLLKLRTTKLYGESTVAKILDMVENSSLKKARAENFITKFAHYYTPAVCIGALVLAILPPLVLGGGWLTWISRALTFLVISCPCALVISIPLSFFGGIGGASRCGILIKGGNYLEALANTSIAVFDKTGTLTKGVFAVSQVSPANGCTEKELLEQAALAESFSSHPISKSLREACSELDARRATDAQEIAGHGVRTMVDGHVVLAGNARMMDDSKITYTKNTGTGTVVYVARDGQFLGSVLIADEVKEHSKQAIAALKAQGVRTIMLTGDTPAVAELVAKDLGIDEVHAGLLPADKVNRVEELLATKGKNDILTFAGDGINDAPVLMRADVGIAMGAMGSDAAIEAADVVLMDDDPAKISLAMKISRKCMHIVYQNIVFALAVKAIFLLLGAFGIANMWWAVFADVGVMILAVLNAMRMLIVEKN